MNIELEKIEKGLFQCIPLRNDIIPKYIPLDTASLVDLFIEKNKKQYLDNINKNKSIIWSKFFNMNSKIFKDKKDYTFNYRIITDGIGCSLLFICKDMYGKRMIRQKKINNYIEFPYIDDLNEEQLKEIKNDNFIYIDPGKKNLLYMMDDDCNKFRYTNRQRIKQTERLKHQEIIQKYKKRNDMIKIETQLSGYNCKTCNYEKFKNYIKEKTKINNDLFVKYEIEMFRKLKLRRYINTQRSETKLVNNIKKKYDNKKDNHKITMFIGDWNVSKQMRHFISTPMIGLKRLLKKNFNVITIDEFRTSILDNETEERLENFKVYNENKKGMIKLHSVLARKEEDNVIGLINRDLNSVKNMKKIVNQYMVDQTRPYNFRRGVEIVKIPRESSLKHGCFFVNRTNH